MNIFQLACKIVLFYKFLTFSDLPILSLDSRLEFSVLLDGFSDVFQPVLAGIIEQAALTSADSAASHDAPIFY